MHWLTRSDPNEPTLVYVSRQHVLFLYPSSTLYLFRIFWWLKLPDIFYRHQRISTAIRWYKLDLISSGGTYSRILFRWLFKLWWKCLSLYIAGWLPPLFGFALTEIICDPIPCTHHTCPLQAKWSKRKISNSRGPICCASPWLRMTDWTRKEKGRGEGALKDIHFDFLYFIVAACLYIACRLLLLQAILCVQLFSFLAYWRSRHIFLVWPSLARN